MSRCQCSHRARLKPEEARQWPQGCLCPKNRIEEARSTELALQGIWVLPRFYSCRPATTDDQAL